MPDSAIQSSLEGNVHEPIGNYGVNAFGFNAPSTMNAELAMKPIKKTPAKKIKATNPKPQASVAQTPIVMIRGLGRGKHHWASFKGELKKAFPKREIILVDLPGNGDLSHLDSPKTIKAAATAITTQLELQAVQKPCDFIGLSLGGMITLYLMENSDWVRKATVINTSLGSLNYPLERMKPVALMNLFYARILPTAMQEKMVWKYTAQQPMNKAMVKNWVNVANIYKVSTRNLWRQLLIAHSCNKKPLLGKKNKDLLILSSEKDELVSARCSKNLAKHTQSEYKVHKFAGHDLPLDDPKWVASCTYQFFTH